jgi:hypothetical protein
MRALTLTLALAATACGATPEAPMPTASAAPLTLEGEAHNAKLGAIVIGTSRGDVYCRGLDEWPDAVVGTRVRVTGQLQVTDQFKARVDADGAISQGTSGGDTVLLGCSWAPL